MRGQILVLCGLLLLAAPVQVCGASGPERAEPALARVAPDPALDAIRDRIHAGRYAEAETEARKLLAADEARYGVESLETAFVLDALVESLWRGGKADAPESRQLAERAVRIKERGLGSHDPEVARSLLNLAGLDWKTGAFKDGIEAGERSLAIREKALGPDHPDVAQSLNMLGNLHLDAGDYRGAKPLYERALAIREKAFGPESLDVARSVENLGILCEETGEYAQAKSCYERSLAIKVKVLGPEHPDVAVARNNFGNLLRAMGEYAAAKSQLERAVAIYEKTLGPEHPNVARSLMLLGWDLDLMGDYAAARPILERAVEIDTTALGPENPDVASALEYLAVLHDDAGEYRDAKPLFERALTVREKTLGPEHRYVAQVLGNLANVLQHMGDFKGARPLYERAIAIREKAVGPEHPEVAAELMNLANLLERMGDYKEGVPLCERALSIYEKSLGPDHPDVAEAANNLANLRFRSGDAPGARQLYERSLALRKKALPVYHPKIAESMDNLALFLAQSGDYAAARPLFEKAASIYEKSLGPEHPKLADTLHNLADLLDKAGDPFGATPLEERAFAIREKALGRDHPALAQSLLLLAVLREETGDGPGALRAALQAEEIGRDHLRLTVRALSERQALRYAATRESGLNLALTLAARGTLDAASRAAVWDAMVRSRALVLDEMGARHHAALAAQSTPEVASWAKELAAARERLANLIVRGPGSTTPEQYRGFLEDARRAKEQAERALAERSESVRQELARSELGLDAVLRELPAGSALVAYVRYENAPQPTPFPNAGTAVPTAPQPTARVGALPSYLVFVARGAAGPVHVIHLGRAADIEPVIAGWRAAVAQPFSQGGVSSASGLESDSRRTGEELRRRIWDPVAPHLEGAKRVFVVPDGALNLVSFAALPTGASAYLVENGPTLHYLSAERDLLPIARRNPASRGLFALGGPEFDLLASADPPSSKPGREQDAAAVPGSSIYRGERSACGDFRSVHFEALPASMQEVQEIAALWKRESGGERGDSNAPGGGSKRVVELLGSRATEAAFKAEAPRHRVLHVATHGFFLGGLCVSALESARGIGGLRPAAGDEPTEPGENPLILSGLALAGANHRDAAGPGQEDGILTAEEIAALDLRGVEWAVLSACDTGVGEVKAGEGVFGLRRAFQVAGAGTLIMSLWSVEDRSARQWMRPLYQARLGEGADTAESVRRANLEVLRERRAKGLSTNPFYWAGFVAAGDWR